MRLARAGLKNPERPVWVFLFVGPSGTGMTELAKALAEFLFHNERRMIRFDMSEFMEKHSAAKLIGSPPGYVGHDEGGQLTDAIRKHLRPELVNRLTKIVHFNPLGMDAAWGIVGKLIVQLNARIADRGVTVELDESAMDFILHEGFSPEYGARNLERVMDRLLGAPIAEKLLAFDVTGNGMMWVSLVGNRLEFQWHS